MDLTVVLNPGPLGHPRRQHDERPICRARSWTRACSSGHALVDKINVDKFIRKKKK